MSNLSFLGLLFVFIVATLIWVLLTKGDQKIFIKRNNKYILFSIILFFLTGSGLGFLRKLVRFGPEINLILLQIFFLAMGILHLYKLNSYFNWKEDKFIPLRFSFTFFIATLVMLSYFVAQWILSSSIAKGTGNLVINLSTSMLIGIVPLFFDWAHRVWNQIPIVSKEYEPFRLPIDRDPPVFEPSTQIIRLVIQVPYRFQSEESISLTVTAPLMQTLGNVFHHIMDEHNVRRRSPRQIEIAEEQKRSKLYGWLFYKLEKRWWGFAIRKNYLPYNQIIKETGLADRDTIFVERIKTW